MLVSFLAALVAVLFAGWWASRGAKSEDDYYLAGRSYGPVVIGVSAGAAGNSGFLMIGSVGLGYAAGPSGLALPIGVMLGDWLYWTFLAGRVHAATPTETNTVPQRIAQVFPDHSQALVRGSASLILLLCLGNYAAAQVYAVGISIERAFALPIELAVALYVLLICSYTVVGGFRSSVQASLIHGSIMLTTAAIVAIGIVTAIFQETSPMQFVRTSLTSESVRPLAVDGFGFLIQICGFATFGIAMGLGLPTLLVKVFALRDTSQIGIAKWTYIGFTYSIFLTMISLGMLLHVLIPDVENPELGLFEFADAYLHPALTGLVLAGLLAAISSTFEALLVILSSAIGSDMFGEKIELMNQRHIRLLHVGTTATVGVTIAILSLTTTEAMFDTVIYSISALASAFGPAMIITTFGWRTTPLALVLCMLTGLCMSTLWIGAGLDDALNSVLPSFAAALAIHQLILRPQREESIHD